MESQSERVRQRLVGLPVIETLHDLASLVRLSEGKLYNLSRQHLDHYKRYDIPKNGGGVRTICQPSRGLKAIQAWILNRLLLNVKGSRASKGFERGASILDAASPHIGARALATLDIEDFFPSVPACWVFSLFRTLGYSPKIAHILTSLCTLDGGLPQGSPCSPKLANLVCQRLDMRLLGFVGRRGITYTRYSDDLAFSAYSSIVLSRALPGIRAIIENEGFSINERKTRVSGPSRAHRVTGLVVTTEGVGIGRRSLRDLRSRINDLRRIPSDGNATPKIDHLRGWLAYVRSVDEPRYKNLKKYVHTLQMKSPNSAVGLLAASLPGQALRV